MALGNINSNPGAGTPVGIDDVGGTIRGVQFNKILDGTTGSVNAAIVNASGELLVKIGSAITPGVGATDLGKAEDAAHTTGDVGVAALGVRRDADTTPVTTDGDYHNLLMTNLGYLKVSVKEHIPLPAGTNNIGDVDVLSLPAIPAGSNNIGDVDVLTLPAIPAGSNNIGDVDVLTLPALVAGAATIGSIASITTSVIPGTAATNLGKAIDSASAGTDTGVAALAIRDDALSTLTPIDGDYVHLRVNSLGALHVTGGGGGTEFAEDTAHNSGDLGSMPLAVRRDANTSLVDTTGDYAPLQVSALGALKVAITEGAGGGVSDVDNSSFVLGTDPIVPMGALVDDTAPGAATENNIGVPRMTASRIMLSRIVGATDANRMDIDASGRPTVNVNGTVPVSIAADVGITELPAAATLADNTTNPSLSSISTYGLVFDGTQWDRQPGNTLGTFAQGNVASDAAVSANPLLGGGRASIAIPTAVSTDGDAVADWRDLSGAEIGRPRPTGSATLANVAASASNVTLLASSTARLGATFVNDSTVNLFLKFGATASATSYTVKIPAGGYYELPNNGTIYTGIIDGIWDSATGNCRVTSW